MSFPFSPDQNTYDYTYGIDPQVIHYVRESILVALRISPFRFYLLHQNLEGQDNGSAASPITITSYSETSPNYKSVIWASGSNFPDLRPYADAVKVLIDNVPAVRVLSVKDLINDNEFALVRRVDLPSSQVEVVFNVGFDASVHTIQYWYTTIQSGITSAVKRGDDPTASKFNWSQYLNPYCDDYQDVNQILVRVPLTTRDLIINEEGKVAMEENQCWTIWTPYVRDFDLLILPASETLSGVEERYEIINKQDSVIQHVFTSQRFHIKLIEQSDPRYKLTYKMV